MRYPMDPRRLLSRLLWGKPSGSTPTRVADFTPVPGPRDTATFLPQHRVVSLASLIQEELQRWLDTAGRPARAAYVVDSWFLRTLGGVLTDAPEEDIRYVTGIEVDGLKVLYRMREMALSRRSVAGAEADGRSSVAALMEMLRHGNRLLAVAHSHPGNGPGATRPSAIDIDYLGAIQRAGAQAIGVIVSRDNCVGFHTVTLPFTVQVVGKGTQEIGKDVYRIDPVTEG